jgi:hypothetical protein
VVEWTVYCGGTKMKIEFYSTVDGVIDAFPVQYAKDCLPSWIGLAKQDYVSNKMNPSIFKCPGIVDILTTGFIIKAWHDIDVQSIDVQSGNRLIGYAPSADLENMLGCPPVQVQGGHEIAKHMPKRPWSHEDILKINTPWHIVAPKGIRLMMLPISYGDQFMFESTTGILDPSISNEVNIQGYVNGLGTIKSGTPLVHIIPMTSEKYNLVVRNINDHDRSWVKKKKYLNSFSFLFNRKKTKEAYEEHYKSKCPFHFGSK